MWLVIYKEHYYPSVFECKTKEEAEELYERIKREEFGDPDYDNPDKLYMAEIFKSHGEDSNDVEWKIFR